MKKMYIALCIILLGSNACASTATPTVEGDIAKLQMNTETTNAEYTQAASQTPEEAQILSLTPTPYPTPSTATLVIDGHQGESLTTICLEVEQSGYEQNVEQPTEQLLENLGLMVKTDNLNCDADLSVVMNFSAFGVQYSGMSGSCYSYHGASMSGSITLTISGGDPIVYSIDEQHEPPEKILESSCINSPINAPFDSVWKGALIDTFAEIWGLPVYVEALDVDGVGYVGLNRIQNYAENVTDQIVIRLIYKLQNQTDESVRSNIANILGKIGPRFHDYVIPALVALLQDPNEYVRQEAIESIGKIGAPAAETTLHTLIEMLEDNDERVKGLSAQTIGSFGSAAADAVPALIALLEEDETDRDTFLKKMTITALGDIGPDAKDATEVLVGVLNEPGTLEGDLDIKSAAAQALGLINPDPELVLPVLLENLRVENQELQVQTLLTLGRLGSLSAEAVPEIVHILESDLSYSDSPSAIRYAAVFAIGGIGPVASSGATILWRLLEDPLLTDLHPWIWLSLAQIGEIDELRAVDELARFIIEDEGLILGGRSSLYALREIQPEVAVQALPVLIDVLKAEGNTFEGSIVMETIGSMGSYASPAIPHIIDILQDESNVLEFIGYSSAVWALGRIGPEAIDGVPFIIRFLTSENAYTRSNAIEALISITDNDFGEDPSIWQEWWESR